MVKNVHAEPNAVQRHRVSQEDRVPRDRTARMHAAAIAAAGFPCRIVAERNSAAVAGIMQKTRTTTVPSHASIKLIVCFDGDIISGPRRAILIHTLDG